MESIAFAQLTSVKLIFEVWRSAVTSVCEVFGGWEVSQGYVLATI